MRYTTKSLEADVRDLNQQLADAGREESIKVQPRNGYCAVDLYIGTRCHRNLQSGTPRECAFEATGVTENILSNL